ncbi:MAG: capsular biosynthesis protein [Betaproteobacteria bacterium]
MKGPTDDHRIVIDVDMTLCGPKPKGGTYLDCPPRADVIATLRRFQAQGYYVIVQSARQMRTYASNVGEINVHTLPVLIEWLQKYDVPHDEIIVGKPWCGHEGFYVDDRAIRPSEFTSMSAQEIQALLAHEKGAIAE